MTEWAHVPDKRNGPTLAAWNFRDQFRPRSFRLVFHTDGTYSATGDERLEPQPAPPVKIKITDDMMTQLITRVPAEDRTRADDLLVRWQEINSEKPIAFVG
jgi:hypothetical protein